MKSIPKKMLQKKDQMAFVEREIHLLKSLKNDFIVDLKCSFKSDENFHMVFEFMPGGDLFQHLRQAKRFGVSRAKFYAAQIVLAIEYLHSKGIIYR
jgi:serine/threonine protein kinase